MSIEKLTQQPLTIGVELPLDNDWSTSGQLKRQRDGRPFGVPDMSAHAQRIKLADTLGFRAARSAMFRCTTRSLAMRLTSLKPLPTSAIYRA